MTTALDELKQRFTDELAAIQSLHDYAGDDWWQLSAAEAEVFGLELDDMPALVSAWAMYEAVADIAYPEVPGTLPGQQPVCSLGRFRRGREDGAVVALQDHQPVLDITCVIDTQFGRDAEIAAQKGRAEFGYQLFHRIGFIAEPRRGHPASASGSGQRLRTSR